MKHKFQKISGIIFSLGIFFQCLSPFYSAFAQENSQNLAAGGIATATYEELDGTGNIKSPALHVNDGDLSTRWSSYYYGGTSTLPQAVQIDLQEVCQIEEVTSYWYGDGRTYGYDLYLSQKPAVVGGVLREPAEAGATVVADLKASGSGESDGQGSVPTVVELEQAVQARYVTLVCRKVSTGSTAAVWEIEIAGERRGKAGTIVSLEEVPDRTVLYGTPVEELGLEAFVDATLDNQTVVQTPLKWSCDEYHPDRSGTYRFTGTPDLSGLPQVANPQGIQVTAMITVLEQGETFAGRKQVSLNDGWRFYKGAVLNAAAVDFDDGGWEKVDLPHTWNAFDGQDGGNDYYRGEGWYRRSFPWRQEYEEKQLFLEFEGSNIQTDVYINGQLAGTHKGGYTAFRFNITPYIVPEQANQIAVRVDNRYTQEIAPLTGDFTFFGGLYRGVSLLAVEPAGHVELLDHGAEGLYLTPTDVSDSQATLRVNADIVNDSAQPQSLTVTAELRNPEPGSVKWIDSVLPREWLPFDPREMTPGGSIAVLSQSMVIPAGGSEAFEQIFTVENPRLWNGKSDPYRYEVELVVRDESGEVLDRISDFVGFRYDEVDADKGYFLNGNSYPLRGVNRHQDRQDMGWAIHDAEHEQDFALIYEIGANTVRLAHYPQADYFYELCDMYGIVVWAEIPFVNEIGGDGSYEEPNAARQAFFETTRQQLTELIRQQYNRPSIICWGLQNEIRHGDFEGVAQKFLSELNDLAHAEDPTRFTTQALYNATTSDTATWPSDVVSWNLYSGWYYGTADGFGSDVDSRRAKDPDRPVGISEYGFGANISHHQEVPLKPKVDQYDSIQSEEYQCLAHEKAWAAIDSRDYLWATHVWNMFDFAVDNRNEAQEPGKNNKGLVTYDRQTKKDAFYFYKANWSDQPVLHINSKRFAVRETDSIQVKGYSNLDSVELIVNGMSCGTLTQEELEQKTVFVWEDISLKPGENIAVMRGVKNGQTYEDTAVWKYGDAGDATVASAVLRIDQAAQTIALTQPVRVQDLAALLTVGEDAVWQVLQADEITLVPEGEIQPGMLLRVTSGNGENTLLYAFVMDNLATGHPAKASSAYAVEDSQAGYAVDGDSSTRWTADMGSSARYPEWLTVDLGQSYILDRVDIDWYTGSGDRAYYYQIEVSEDGLDYHAVAVHTENTVAGCTTDDLKGIRGRFVRLTVTGNSEFAQKPTAAASLFELRVYGWNIASNAYTIDDTAHTITLPRIADGVPVAKFWGNISLTGQVTPALTGKEVLTGGERLILTDVWGRERVYTLLISPLQKGDVDANGDISAADALLALQAATGKLKLTDTQQSTADVDEKDGVTSSDALLILQFATQKIRRF